MLGRKPAKTSAQQALDELAQSYGHLKRAAGHAAGSAAEWMQPRAGMAKNAAAKNLAKGSLAPLAPLIAQFGQLAQPGIGPGQAPFGQMGEGFGQQGWIPKEWGAKDWGAKGWGAKDWGAKGWGAKATKGRGMSKKMIGLVAAGTAVGVAGAMAAKRRRASAEWNEYEPTPEEVSYAEQESARGRKMTQGFASMADAVSSKASKMAESMHEKAARMENQESTTLRPPTAPSAPDVVPGMDTTAQGSSPHGPVGTENLG